MPRSSAMVPHGFPSETLGELTFFECMPAEIRTASQLCDLVRLIALNVRVTHVGPLPGLTCRSRLDKERFSPSKLAI